jgi:hypothetical protein
MTQIGYNTGPWNARVWGLAKSYKQNIDKPTQKAHDIEAMGAFAILFGLAHTTLPSEIMQVLDQSLANAGVPQMATQNIGSGELTIPSKSPTKRLLTR